MPSKKLEQYKYFQPIAWTLCVSFAGFVGMIALQMEDQIQKFNASSISYEQRLQTLEEVTGITQQQ